MPRAVQFDQYGGVDVLNVVDVARPVPGPAQALVRVKAAGINPDDTTEQKGMEDGLLKIEVFPKPIK